MLFVCHGNTCRSVIAAALARQRFPGFDISSAGTDAWQQTAQPWTIEVLETDHDIDATNHKPTHISTLDLDLYDVVVALDGNCAATLAERRADPGRLVEWNVPDPYGGSLEAYRETVHQIVPHLDALTERLRKEGAIA
jgi:protein-tyrosine phosphatase